MGGEGGKKRKNGRGKWREAGDKPECLFFSDKTPCLFFHQRHPTDLVIVELHAISYIIEGLQSIIVLKMGGLGYKERGKRSSLVFCPVRCPDGSRTPPRTRTQGVV